MSVVEEEVHYVAVFDHIFFPLDTHLACVAHRAFPSEGDEVFIFYDLGADEAFLEVGMYDSGAFGRFPAVDEGSCAHLVGSGGEECLEVEKGVSRAYQS